MALGIFGNQSANQPVKAKVLRDFYFKSQDEKPSVKPKKVFHGTDLTLTAQEYAIHSHTNRVCLPEQYEERRKAYATAKPAEQGKK